MEGVCLRYVIEKQTKQWLGTTMAAAYMVGIFCNGSRTWVRLNGVTGWWYGLPAAGLGLGETTHWQQTEVLTCRALLEARSKGKAETLLQANLRCDSWFLPGCGWPYLWQGLPGDSATKGAQHFGKTTLVAPFSLRRPPGATPFSFAEDVLL